MENYKNHIVLQNINASMAVFVLTSVPALAAGGFNQTAAAAQFAVGRKPSHSCSDFRESRGELWRGCKRNSGKRHQSSSNKGGIFSKDLSKNHIASAELGNPPDFNLH